MRNLVGFGQPGASIQWPNQARIALNFVVNYEEGAELTPVNGDAQAETYGGEFPLATKPLGMRNLSQESIFEYGARAGIWRLIRLFDALKIPLTFFVTGLAIQQNPEFAAYLRQANHEIAGHGWRWIDYALLSKAEEKKHIQHCIETILQLTGKRITGWYTGRRSEYTRQLLHEIGGFAYDSDSYADDVPYFEAEHLIVPYTLDCNDFRFGTTPGFSHGDMFYQYLKNTFDVLYQEQRTAMMTVGLHPRYSGRPGRCWAVQQFLAHVSQFADVWITRRVDIAHYWQQASLK